MYSTDATVTPHPDVVCTSLKNGESVLLHLGTNTYYSLNETGAVIWALIEQTAPLATIGEALAGRYDVSLERAHQSVAELVTELTTEKLIVVGNGASDQQATT
jgi:hypothetical protein